MTHGPWLRRAPPTHPTYSSLLISIQEVISTSRIIMRLEFSSTTTVLLMRITGCLEAGAIALHTTHRCWKQTFSSGKQVKSEIIETKCSRTNHQVTYDLKNIGRPGLSERECDIPKAFGTRWDHTATDENGVRCPCFFNLSDYNVTNTHSYIPFEIRPDYEKIRWWYLCVFYL